MPERLRNPSKPTLRRYRLITTLAGETIIVIIFIFSCYHWWFSSAVIQNSCCRRSRCCAFLKRLAPQRLGCKPMLSVTASRCIYFSSIAENWVDGGYGSSVTNQDVYYPRRWLKTRVVSFFFHPTSSSIIVYWQNITSFVVPIRNVTYREKKIEVFTHLFLLQIQFHRKSTFFGVNTFETFEKKKTFCVVGT